MHCTDDHFRAAADRILPVRMRGDLHVVEVAFDGHAAYVVQDPVAEEAFYLTAEEYALLESLRWPVSLRDLQRTLETRFPPRRATVADLQRFITRLYEQGLLVGENPGQGAALVQLGRRQRRRQRLARLMQVLTIRLARCDAGPIVERFHAACGWLSNRTAIVAAAGVIGAGLWTAIAHAAELAERLPGTSELADPRQAPLWLAAIAGVKAAHELGHALVCRRLGARPREFGLLLVAGLPTAYCDVSDAWRLPSKWQRMAVSAAGMAVELVIAALAVLVWRHAAPGLLSNLCLSLVVVCSASTLLVNANPLLRYDGYYLLADWLETPNLADRARGLASGAWRRWLLGETADVDPLLGPHKRRALWAYAALAKLYLALVLAGLFIMLLAAARPYHLENAVYTLAAAAVAGLLARPAAAVLQTTTNPALRRQLRRRRLLGALAVAGLVLAAASLVPVTRRVAAPLTVVPAETHPLFAVVAGELEFAADPHCEVDAGSVVVRLRNPQVELALAQQQGLVRELRAKCEQLRLLQATLQAALQMLPTAQAELAAAEAQWRQQKTIVDALTIRAPVAGRLLPPPRRAEEPSADMLRRWQGSPLEKRNRGAWIEAGTPLAVVAAPGGQLAWAGVEQADAPLVASGQPVRLWAEQAPATVVRGRVVEVARRARGNRAGDGHPPGQGQQANSGRYHVVQIELAADAPRLLPGARGVAKIETTRSTVGAVVVEQLRRTFLRAF
ncbi:MAG: hypothetical protein DCC67_11790 [Planctomycetota bacterium]|nr:MAG: hypothetical protein DCC67_11790 [Planctomycetota bacterium]